MNNSECVTARFRRYLDRELGHRKTMPVLMLALTYCDQIDKLYADLKNKNEALQQCLKDTMDENENLRATLNEKNNNTEPVDTEDVAIHFGPVDSKGVPIQLGDTVEIIDNPNNQFNVKVMKLTSQGWRIAARDQIGVTFLRPEKCRHYHEPTVSDILYELADDIKGADTDYVVLAIERYAKRLQLADGDAK